MTELTVIVKLTIDDTKTLAEQLIGEYHPDNQIAIECNRNLLPGQLMPKTRTKFMNQFFRDAVEDGVDGSILTNFNVVDTEFDRDSCPCCKSDDTNSDDGSTSYEDWHCNNCSANWTNYYTFSGQEITQQGNDTSEGSDSDFEDEEEQFYPPTEFIPPENNQDEFINTFDHGNETTFGRT